MCLYCSDTLQGEKRVPRGILGKFSHDIHYFLLYSPLIQYTTTFQSSLRSLSDFISEPLYVVLCLSGSFFFFLFTPFTYLSSFDCQLFVCLILTHMPAFEPEQFWKKNTSLGFYIEPLRVPYMDKLESFLLLDKTILF